MSNALLFAVAMMAQGSAAVQVSAPWSDRAVTGSEDLVEGRPQAAIDRVSANPEAVRNDPAALINLGTAYARIGDNARARSYYLAAIASRDHADLQLSDGRWMDSRLAARKAARVLGAQGTLVATRTAR